MTKPDEQPVTVTHEDYVAATKMLDHAFRNAPSDCCDDVALVDIASAFARHRQASTPTAQIEAMREACARVAESWRDPAFATEHENRCFGYIAAAIRALPIPQPTDMVLVPRV